MAIGHGNLRDLLQIRTQFCCLRPLAHPLHQGFHKASLRHDREHSHTMHSMHVNGQRQRALMPALLLEAR